MISKTQVNKAGEKLRTYPHSSKEYKQALEIAEEWRKAHIYPLKTFKSNLDKRLMKYKGSISAQRLKRMPTILDKLKTRESSMRLSAMQDIGGVRAIVAKVSQAEKLAKEYETSKRFTHLLKKSQNYINSPKDDGYRGIHLIYEYNNTLARTKKAEESKGKLIEIQIRSRLQHIWATAVETVGLMTGQSIKLHRGSEEWLEFFQYVSSIFAIIEKRNVLQAHAGKEEREIYEHVIQLIDEMQVFDKLAGYSTGLEVIEKANRNHYYHLIVLNIEKKEVKITGFAEIEYNSAIHEYEEIESAHEANIDAVLVSTNQRQELKKAYPNYYLDLRELIELLNTIMIEYKATK